METDSAPAPSREAVDSAMRLYNDIRAAFPKAVANFESRWSAAAQILSRSETASSVAGDDDAYTQTEEFDALKKLGPKIIPFVVFKLATDDSGEDSWGVFLYPQEDDLDYRCSLSPDMGLRQCSAQIVELNYQRNKLVRNRCEAWKQQNRDNWLQTSTLVFTGCEEYFDLLEMGTSIIAQLMLEYYYDPGGFWYDLLHEITHGHKMGAYMVEKPAWFQECCRFFDEGEHAQAPKYIQTPMDRHIYHGESLD